jgi:hypothetical protein
MSIMRRPEGGACVRIKNVCELVAAPELADALAD